MYMFPQGRMYIFPSNISREDVCPPSLREDVHPPSAKGACTSSLRWGRMYMSPSREDVHPPWRYFKGGCTSSLGGDMYVLPQRREDVHPPFLKGDRFYIKLFSFCSSNSCCFHFALRASHEPVTSFENHRCSWKNMVFSCVLGENIPTKFEWNR